MTEPHSPRKNDHLVEPFYSGLGAEGESRDRRRWLPGILLALAVVALAGWLLFGS